MPLTETQQNTLHAAMDRIIPPDDFPGAWDAGVGDYVTRQLNGDLRTLLPTYRYGLDGLEAEAQTRFDTAFSSLTAAQQDALLRDVAANTVQTFWLVGPSAFFGLLIQHTAEGYYSDHGNGGNRDEISWKMIGFLPGRKESQR